MTKATGQRRCRLLSHLIAAVQKSLKLMENGVMPLWVFDGAPGDFKSETVKKRESRKKESERVLKESLEKGDFETAMKASKQSISLKQEEVDSLRDLLEVAGVPYSQADSEADHKLAKLSRAGLISAVISEDGDLMAHGVDTILRADKPASFVAYRKQDILKSLDIDDAQFVDLCILLGTDYNDNAKGMGPQTALKLVQNLGNIEKIIEENKKFDLEDMKSKYKTIREIFSPAHNKETDLIVWPKFNEEGLKQLLTLKKFKKDNVEKYTKKFAKAHSKLSI